MMYSLGIDIGSSSVKVSIFSLQEGDAIASAQYPPQELPIIAQQKGWAEQEPDLWWNTFLQAMEILSTQTDLEKIDIKYIGISYQMHGLVCLDKNMEPLRPSIIWCDSRAQPYGDKAFNEIGKDYCLNNLLNSPGNFTSAKLKWVQENEPELYARIHRICLPGDYIGYKLTGRLTTTHTGLSEGIFYDFQKGGLSSELMNHFSFSEELIPEVLPSFSDHGKVDPDISTKINVHPDACIYYKSGDQPNNAFSLNVLEPGEIAATAGTSGVVYGVTDEDFIDEKQRVNSFVHVNHNADKKRVGVLLCINGTGIANAWTKRLVKPGNYSEMNMLAENISAGSDGLKFYPFGNGSERMLSHYEEGARLEGIDFNRHSDGHIIRAVQEGIAFAFAYGMEAFYEKGIEISVIRAGYANMFQSPVFSQTLSDITGVDIHLYNTDGSIGAARGALVGSGSVNETEVFRGLQQVQAYSPSAECKKLKEAFTVWKEKL